MQEHERWLRIAEEDLLVAKVLLEQELFTPLTYHCQQTAEKALKGYLVFKKQEVVKTHDLIKIAALCKKIDRNFEILEHAIELLNPFATKFRYPTEYDVPDFNVAEEAVKQARRILNFVNKKISEPETGQTYIFDLD